MKDITTVDHLITELNNADPSEYVQIIKKINLSATDFSDYMSWSKNGYTRNCIARTETYELILLCWDIGAETPIHGHGGEDCWVYQVHGHVEELRVKKDGSNFIETNRMTLKPGKLTYMHDRMGFHRLKNISNQRAMTLHVYASPIEYCRVYNDKKDCFEIKEMSYDTFEEVETETLAV